jgi:anti-repressor protein
MENIIKITDTDRGPLVSLKELYDFLGFASQHWAKWYKKNIINDIFFEENKDYVQLPLSGSSKTIDFAVSIEMAKEISMLARTEKGKQARQYFIECEKKLREISVPSYQIENPIDRANKWIEEQKKTLLLEEENKKLQYRSDFVDVIFETDGLFGMEETAKILKLPFGRNIMLRKLREKKVLLESNTPKQSLINNGYFKVSEQIIDSGKFKKLVSTTYATSKGVGYIYKILKDEFKL